MKILRLFFCVVLATVVPKFASAALVGPYTADANTPFLVHFDGAAGSSAAINNGTKAGNFYSCDEATGTATPPTVTTMLGSAGYVNGTINFHTCMTVPLTGYLFGYDGNKSGAYQGEGTAPAADAIVMTNLNIGFGGQTPFTIEALIQPNTVAGNQEIICTDSSSGTVRGFQFRIASATLEFKFLTGTALTVSANIPTTGADAFVAGTWYHVAMVYNGTTATLYWTKMDPANGAAHILGAPATINLGVTQGACVDPLCIGNENRGAAAEPFQGCIDEVRISSVARAANKMQFNSPAVTITANPISQNVDYNQPVTFSVGAASETALGYQWRFNSTPIPGLTNSSFTITNVAAVNAGAYDCVVTNAIGYSATSAAATLVVGAANFLANRYSFTSDTTDSIGGQTGSLFGNATVTGGQLVLDGTSGTYMELPAGLFNGANSTALTVEFWATYGVNPNNVYVFGFGVTNFLTGSGIVGFNYVTYSPHNAGGQMLAASPSDPNFVQSQTATGNLDGRTVHVACVIDPPTQTLSIYTNGVLEAVKTNFTVSIGNLNDQFSYIGRSLWANDPYLNASIDELRIFKGALSSLTIKQSDDQGPNTLLADGPGEFVVQPVDLSVPAGQTATFTASAVGYLPIHYQWFRNGSPVTSATNSTLSFATVLADSGTTIKCYATNTIGVTTYVTVSATATLTVFIPPTLAWLDGGNGAQDSTWNTSSPDWVNTSGGGVLAFAQNDSVLFDSRGSGSPSVDVAEAVTPYNLKANATVDYLLYSSANTGSLNGQGGITKLNSGKLTIDLTNNLTGATTISGGILQIGNGDANGSLGSGPVTNNATLSFNRSDTAVTVANAIHGSGVVSFDGSGTVTMTGANDYTGSTLINAGVVLLQTTNGLGTASSGTTVANGAQLYLTANVDLTEGLTLNGSGNDGSGALRKSGAGLTTSFGTVNLDSDATIGVDFGATLTLSNTVSGPGALTARGGGVLALDRPNSYSGGTTLAGAIVNFNTNGALGTGMVTVSDTNRLVIGTGLNFTNALTANTISPGPVTGLLMVNDNTNGTVTTISGPLALNAVAANGGHFIGPASSGYLNVSGAITMPGATPLSIRLGNLRFGGVGSSYDEIQVRANTTSLGANNGIAVNAVMDIGGNGSTTVPTTFDLNGFNQTLTGLKNTVSAAANVAWITNSGASLATLSLELGGNTYSFNGSILGNVSLVLNSGSQLLGNNGAALNGRYTYTGKTVINGGTLMIGGGINLANTPSISIADGAALDASISGLVLSPLQAITGNGMVYGNVSGGGVSPGPGIGALTFNGDLALSGPTTIELNKAAGTNDQLIVLGSLTYGGTLLVTNLAGTLAAGDTFKFVTAGSSSGDFARVNGYAGPGKVWHFNPANGVLSIVNMATYPTNLTATVSGKSIVISWPSDHQGWTLQAQTNALTKGLGTNWVNIAGTAGVTVFTNTVVSPNSAVFYRMVYP